MQLDFEQIHKRFVAPVISYFISVYFQLILIERAINFITQIDLLLMILPKCCSEQHCEPNHR